eukprot:TRINITY_DN1764_c0_g1_i2.p1 TRINITY_DN1764_c0_g1~~TRINITY_DN1764_c0_g1_i2.p1  ORF type:complete len:206 (+),score=64.85 TRINITY_DN1764_c0_g1_i2:50-619(+)
MNKATLNKDTNISKNDLWSMIQKVEPERAFETLLQNGISPSQASKILYGEAKPRKQYKRNKQTNKKVEELKGKALFEFISTSTQQKSEKINNNKTNLKDPFAKLSSVRYLENFVGKENVFQFNSPKKRKSTLDEENQHSLNSNYFSSPLTKDVGKISQSNNRLYQMFQKKSVNKKKQGNRDLKEELDDF